MLLHSSNINQLIRHFLKRKRKREAPVEWSPMLEAPVYTKDQASITDFQLSSSDKNKYGRNHPRQKVITSAIMDMIIKNLIPVHIIEKDGFRDLIHTLGPKYTIVSQQCLQYKLVPEKADEINKCLIQQLLSISS